VIGAVRDVLFGVPDALGQELAVVVEVPQDGRGGERLEHRADGEALVRAVQHSCARGRVAGEHTQASGMLLLQLPQLPGDLVSAGR
jgi:hypothetical protein